MKIKVLIENTTDSDLVCEHGLSLYMEFQDKRILLDAGSSEAFAENAEQMGVDLSAVDIAFLSHGHYDHSGGFGVFVRKNQNAPVYAMEKAMGNYASTSGGVLHEIGVPTPIKEALGERLVQVEGMMKIGEGITLVPHGTALKKLVEIGEKAGLYRDVDGEWFPDDFAHEMSVVLETARGLVICNSCSHGGVQNIVSEVKQALPGKKIYAYIGGLHMKGTRNSEEICAFSEDEVGELSDFVRKEGIEILLTGHCTGEPGLKLLEKNLGTERLLRLCSGTVFEFGNCDRPA